MGKCPLEQQVHSLGRGTCLCSWFILFKCISYKELRNNPSQRGSYPLFLLKSLLACRCDLPVVSMSRDVDGRVWERDSVSSREQSVSPSLYSSCVYVKKSTLSRNATLKHHFSYGILHKEKAQTKSLSFTSVSDTAGQLSVTEVAERPLVQDLLNHDVSRLEGALREETGSNFKGRPWAQSSLF